MRGWRTGYMRVSSLQHNITVRGTQTEMNICIGTCVVSWMPCRNSSQGASLFLVSVWYAGADIILIPSFFEPCGLTQLIALRYGTIPVMSQTGGLADTVRDVANDHVSTNVGAGFVSYTYKKNAWLTAPVTAVRRHVLLHVLLVAELSSLQ